MGGGGVEQSKHLSTSALQENIEHYRKPCIGTMQRQLSSHDRISINAVTIALVKLFVLDSHYGTSFQVVLNNLSDP